MAELRIGDHLIGDGHPSYIIAEIGVNHNGMVPLAFELIDMAIDSGVDAVKFVNSPAGKQLHLRGINAKVVQPGVIRAGDRVTKLQ